MNKPTYDELIAALSESDHSNLRIKYGKLKAERDALAAQVEHLKANNEMLMQASWEIKKCVQGEFFKVGDIVNTKPAKCLADIKAQAGRDGFIAGYELCQSAQSVPAIRYHNLHGFADKYANQIRHQANGGTWLKDSNTHCNAKAGE